MSEFRIFQVGLLNNNDLGREFWALGSYQGRDRDAVGKEFGMIVTIDGPAGAGKSSVARKLADALGFAFLDTGAMYRCVTLLCLERGIDWQNSDQIIAIAKDCEIEFRDQSVYLNGSDVTDAIRDVAVSGAIKYVADHVEVRKLMVKAQQEWSKGKELVTEGRDQGTVVFPQAECKIFLTASAEERAARRCRQLAAMNKEADYEAILAAQKERDRHDMSRPVGGLVAADDATHVNTDGMTEEEVLSRLIALVRGTRTYRAQSDSSRAHASSRQTGEEPEVGNGVA